MSPASHNASSALPPTPPGVGGDEWKGKAGTLAAKGKDVDDGDAVTDIQKKMKRAARFGMPVHLSEEEKRNTRAERFGTVSEGLHSSKQSEELKKQARVESYFLGLGLCNLPQLMRKQRRRPDSLDLVSLLSMIHQKKLKRKRGPSFSSRFSMIGKLACFDECDFICHHLEERFSQQDSGLKGNGKGDVVRTVSGGKAGKGN